MTNVDSIYKTPPPPNRQLSPLHSALSSSPANRPLPTLSLFSSLGTQHSLPLPCQLPTANRQLFLLHSALSTQHSALSFSPAPCQLSPLPSALSTFVHGCESFNPIIPITIKVNERILKNVAGSLKSTIPNTNAPAAPIPVHTA